MESELELRRRQLEARKDRPGLNDNVEALKKRIAELEAASNGV